MKKFLVTVIASRRVIVEAENAEAAEAKAASECDDFDCDIDTWKVEKELVTEHEIARAKAHDAVDLEDF